MALSITHYRTDGQLTFWPSDVALYDIDSQVMRRVTMQPGYLRAMRLSNQHLLVGELTGPSPQSWNWYVLDLRQLGLVERRGMSSPAIRSSTRPILEEPSSRVEG